MPNCSNCGSYISSYGVYKRQIYVGSSNRVNYGKRSSYSNAKHYRIRSVCKKCAEYIDKQNVRRRRVSMIFWILVIAAILYYLLK